MRDIKFRGQRIDSGEWVYGYYYKLSSQHFIGFDVFSWEVNPETVGQLLAKVKREDDSIEEIFEGDLIVHGQRILKVSFSNGNTTLVNKGNATGILLSFNDGKKKVGNIFSNPELLTQ